MEPGGEMPGGRSPGAVAGRGSAATGDAGTRGRLRDAGVPGRPPAGRRPRPFGGPAAARGERRRPVLVPVRPLGGRRGGGGESARGAFILTGQRLARRSEESE